MLDTTTGRDMQLTHAIIGRSPGSIPARLGTAALRALRTLIQGIAAAFPAAGAGTIVLQTTYWKTFGYSCLAALIAAIVSFLQNAAGILPEDPTQQPPGADLGPVHPGPGAGGEEDPSPPTADAARLGNR